MAIVDIKKQTNRVSKRKFNKTPKVPFTLKILISVITLITSVIALVNVLLQDTYISKKPSILINPLDINMSQNINTDIPIYELAQKTYLSDDDIQHFMDISNDMDAQIVSVTNNNQYKDICLTEFSLVVNNIEVNYSPYLEIERVETLEKEKNDLTLNLMSKGWKDIKNVIVEVIDEKGILNLEKYNKTIKNLRYGSENTLNYSFDEKDFYGSDEYIIKINVKYKDQILTSISEYLIYENGHLVVADGGGKGGLSDFIYGICIPTDGSSFTLTENIQENIGPGEILEMPVIFFPDRSCTFDYYIEFKVNNGGKEQTIRTDNTNSKFIISSLRDVKEYDCKNEEKILKNYKYVNLITYPYCKRYMNQ